MKTNDMKMPDGEGLTEFERDLAAIHGFLVYMAFPGLPNVSKKLCQDAISKAADTLAGCMYKHNAGRDFLERMRKYSEQAATEYLKYHLRALGTPEEQLRELDGEE